MSTATAEHIQGKYDTEIFSLLTTIWGAVQSRIEAHYGKPYEAVKATGTLIVTPTPLA